MAMNYYDMLGVERDATLPEIKHAYRKALSDNHPDRPEVQAMDPAERMIAENIAKDAGRAYQELRDPERRARYDEKLEREESAAPRFDPAQPDSAPTGQSTQGRRRVNVQDQRSPAGGRFEINPENWPWFTPAQSGSDVSDARPSRLPAVASVAARILGPASWVLWAIVSIYWWRGPILASGQGTDEMTWWLAGPVVHVIVSILVATKILFKKAVLIIVGALVALSVALVAVQGAENLTAPAAWIAAAAPLGAVLGSVVTTFWALRSLFGRKKTILDTESFISVGAHSLGERHRDITSLIGALHTAFGHRSGVRVMVFPDRVTVPQVKTQAIVIVGHDVHLLSIPPLGDDGFEISGRYITASGGHLRNVVLDEAAELRRRTGRGVGRIYSYVVPTRIGDLQAQEMDQVTYARLDDAIRLIGQRSVKGLDKPSPATRREVFAARGYLLAGSENEGR